MAPSHTDDAPVKPLGGLVDDNHDQPEVLDAQGNPVADTEGPESDPRVNTVPQNLPALSRPTSTARKGDLLAYYLAEVRRYPLLDPEEENALVEDGDTDAANRLVTANLRLVVKLAFQYHRQWSNVLDLIQEGNVGLVEALSRYDPYRGVRFSSYAQYWIRAMILRFLMDNYRLVRLGSTRHGRKLFFQLKKVRDQLINEGNIPSTSALAERLSVPEQEVIDVDRQLSAPALSLHSPVGDADGRALEEMIPGTSRGPDDAVERGELGAVVKEHLDAFARALKDERERVIWNQRLTSKDPRSLADIGQQFSVSKERIRQVEARIKKQLKTFLADALGDEIAFDFDIPEGQ
ncbi:MAG: sigma-70 family RNA polymerase sigma factor [Oligoflexia bacterium]|nr:sigma-70 family RNA polymerase sigma factor [Oligoflexia bacterium]